EAARVEQLDAMACGVLLALRVAAAVRHDELELAHGRGAQVRVVDLAQPAVLQRVPDLAARGVRRPEAVLVGGGPVGLRPRPARRGLRSRGSGNGEQYKGDQEQRSAEHVNALPGSRESYADLVR